MAGTIGLCSYQSSPFQGPGLVLQREECDPERLLVHPVRTPAEIDAGERSAELRGKGKMRGHLLFFTRQELFLPDIGLLENGK